MKIASPLLVGVGGFMAGAGYFFGAMVNSIGEQRPGYVITWAMVGNASMALLVFTALGVIVGIGIERTTRG